MSDLIERIKAALVNANCSVWFPDLTAELAEVGWMKVCRAAGVSRHDYTTSRVLVRDFKAPCRGIAQLPAARDVESNEWVLQVEILDGVLADHYQASGIKFYTAEEIKQANILERLGEAISILERIPTLYATITTLIKSIHIIKLADDDYDVSFSEPHLPFSIFVSVPRLRNDVNALRVAEAIVHEAMHLQLTLIELVIPLVKSTSGQYYSPWRREFRNIQGVLHGLYVFRVIGEFLSELQTLCPNEPDIVDYLKTRKLEIHDQISCVMSSEESKDLTEIGRAFSRRLIAGVKSS
jgi:HEXXH motif-containing protein